MTRPTNVRAGLWRRVPAEAVLVAHLVAAVATLVLAPHGFPFTHPRFWLLTATPSAIAALSVVAIVAIPRAGSHWSGAILCAFAAAEAAMCVAAGWLFPQSLAGLWWAGVLGSAPVWGVAVLIGCRWKTSAAAAVTGAVAGVSAALALRAPAPSTHPLATTPIATSKESSAPVDGWLRIQQDALRISYNPKLTFDRVSPDRFWSLFAPANESPPGGTTISIERDGDSRGVSSTVLTPLPSATYSHLNTFAHVLVDGLSEPTLRFSPSPNERIAVKVAGYPVGAPARFACFDRESRLVVYEASSGEKGPFKELVSGPLARDEPLTIWFADGRRDVAFLRLDDWAAQASTELSPTAGWRIPQNAIEFQRIEGTDSIEVWITLAGTSVGRGWDTVGHKPGVYRNRSRLALAPNQQ